MTDCSTCRTLLAPGATFCPRCGTSQNSRLCSNGHIMDVSWTACLYCQSGASSGSKGRTVVEDLGDGSAGKGRTLAENLSGSGSFVGSATLLGGGAFGGRAGKQVTIAEAGSQKGKTVVEGPSGGRAKAKTVFDSGSPNAGVGAPASRLVGWLVTFSTVATGQDYRLREGRNTIGSDETECDIVLANESSISGKHAVIVCREGQVLVRDNDSTNGTFVNGEDIFGRGAVVVKNLDRLRLGRIDLTLYTLQQ